MKRLLPLLLIVPFFIAAQPAEAKTTRANMVNTAFGWCMIKYGGGVGCSSPAIPSVTDGYVWMRWRGRVRFGDTGGPIGPPARPPFRKLRKGDRWIKRGITCRAYRGLKCWNRAGHGFRLTRRSYRTW